jgi:NADH dehydrogenase
LAHHTLKRDFRQFDPGSAHILLVEGGERLLPSFPASLSAKAKATLARMGVEIQTGARVTDVQPDSISITRGNETQRVATRTVLWAAGVQASPLGRLIAQKTGSEVDKEGRIVVGADLTISGHPELLILGDLAHAIDEDGKPLPGVAQVAIQQGRYAAKLIRRRLAGKNMPAFRYKDLGSLAVIGRNAAVADLNWVRVAGFPAWLLWLFVHLRAMIQFQNRILVLMQWMWSYITRNQSALLIPDKNPNWRLGDVSTGRFFTTDEETGRS